MPNALMTPPPPPAYKAKSDDEKRIAGMVRSGSQKQFAGEFLTPAKDIDEAIAKGVIKPDEESALIQCLSFMDSYKQTDRLLGHMIHKKLLISGAISGFNRSISAMIAIGIAIFEGFGVPMDHKRTLEQMKALDQTQRGNGNRDRERPNKD